MYPDHLTEFHGLPVFDLPSGESSEPLPEAGAVAWRLGIGWKDSESFQQRWERFLETVDGAGVTALVIGPWREDTSDLPTKELQLVIDAAPGLPALRAFFLGDIVSEESEISWIEQTDLAPLLLAYPALEELWARGGHREFTPVRHSALRTLRLESGGMSAAVVRGISESGLPALEHLTLWFGSEDYGGDTTVADLAPLLAGTGFPALRHLGLQDSEVQDDIAAAVAEAPVVRQLDSLALSLGLLTDSGAEALLAGQSLTHLKRLDLHYHFLSDDLMGRLRAALEPAGVELDLSEQEEGEEDDGRVWRYVAVAE